MKSVRHIVTSLVLLAAVFAMPTAARSQAALLVLLFGDDVASENFHFNLKAGANLPNVEGVDGTENRPGFNFGLMGTIKLSEKWSLIPEFMPLSPKGAENIPFASTGDAGLDEVIQPTTSSAMELNYIDVPIVVAWQASKSLALEAGPQVSFLTGATNVYRGRVAADDDVSFERDMEAGFNAIDYGVVAGLSYTLGDARNGQGILLHARYALGLQDIVKDNPGDAVTNSVLQFAISIPFINPPAPAQGSAAN
jgi:hypothetical protein